MPKLSFSYFSWPISLYVMPIHFTEDQRKLMSSKTIASTINNKNVIKKDIQLLKQQSSSLSSDFLDYNLPIGICPKAELEDDCKSIFYTKI